MLINIPIGEGREFLEAILDVPCNATGIVVFAHGSGSSKNSVRNNYVAEILRKNGLATLLMDLLTKEENMNYEMRFDIPLLSRRLVAATKWLNENSQTSDLNVGYFGASTGAAAALNAASDLGDEIVKAIVSRGGRPDLAFFSLSTVKSPTLLIVGGDDYEVIKLNEFAYENLFCDKEMVIVDGATHLFEESGAMDKVAEYAVGWFKKFL